MSAIESEGTVEYLFYCRDNPGTELLLEQLAHAHWSFMDGYADAMIARGPTLTPDRRTHTGSMHMVDLPDDEAARAFAFEEPYYAAGVYGEVLIRRWRNELGRTMWDFRGGADDPRFLIIGHGREGASAAAEALLEEHRRYFVARGYDGRLIERGPLLSDDGTEWAGVAILVELPDRNVADTMLLDDPYGLAGLYATVEIHDWQFGGRPLPRTVNPQVVGSSPTPGAAKLQPRTHP